MSVLGIDVGTTRNAICTNFNGRLRRLTLVLVGLLAGCTVMQVVPENARTFREGLICGMSVFETYQWAKENSFQRLYCPLPSSDGLQSCSAVQGRTNYVLYFDTDGGLTQVAEGYLRTLSPLDYSDPEDLCEEAAK